MKYIEVTDENRNGYMMAKYYDENDNISFRKLPNGFSSEEAGKMLADSLGFKEYILITK